MVSNRNLKKNKREETGEKISKYIVDLQGEDRTFKVAKVENLLKGKKLKGEKMGEDEDDLSI